MYRLTTQCIGKTLSNVSAVCHWP